MNRLSLCISQDDYSVQYGCSAQSSVTTGGFNRYFKRTNSKRHVVTCTTTLSEADYWYFRAFYLDWQDEPQPFICKLVLEGFDYFGILLQDYECSFVKDSVMFDLNALHFRVSFQLDVFINPLMVLTSRPYVYQFTESFDLTTTLDDIELKTPLFLDESFDTGYALNDIQFRQLVNAYDMGFDELNHSYSLDDIQVTATLGIKTYSYAEESNVNYALTDIQVTRQLSVVSYNLDIENFDSVYALTDIQITN